MQIKRLNDEHILALSQAIFEIWNVYENVNLIVTVPPWGQQLSFCLPELVKFAAHLPILVGFCLLFWLMNAFHRKKYGNEIDQKQTNYSSKVSTGTPKY